MYVGCWDCGENVSLTERPRTVKGGWKDTVDVCHACRDKWLEKHPKVKPDPN